MADATDVGRAASGEDGAAPEVKAAPRPAPRPAPEGESAPVPAWAALDLLPFACFTTRGGQILRANPEAQALGFEIGSEVSTLHADLGELVDRAESRGLGGRMAEVEWRSADRTRHVSIHVAPVPATQSSTDGSSIPGGQGGAAPGMNAVPPPPRTAAIGGALVVVDDITPLLETSDELARTVIESEVTNRQLDRSNTILSLLARFGGELMRVESAPRAIELLSRTLHATRLFSVIEIIQPNTTGRVPRWSESVERRITETMESGHAGAGLVPAPAPADGGVLVHPVQGREILHAVIAAQFDPGAIEEAGLIDIHAFASMTAFTLDSLLLYRDLVSSLRSLSFQNRVARSLQETISHREIEARLDELLRSHFPVTWFRILTSPADHDYPEPMRELVRLGFRGHAVVRAVGEGSGISVPIRIAAQDASPEPRLHGILAALSAEPDTFTGPGRELILAITDLASISIRNARAHDDLRAHNVAVQYLNEELSRTVLDLKAANEMKSRFVSIVSHEFRSPLTSIVSHTETLLSDPGIDRETQQTFLGVVRDETERLTRLINQLLDLSRLQARDRELSRIWTDLRDTAEKVAAALKPLALKKQIAFTLTLTGDRCGVLGDPDALRQVFWNLAGNAVRYTLPGGSIEMAVEDDDRFVYIRVRDTGIGIPQDSLDAIFSEFYTVPQTRARLARETDREYLDSTLGGSGTGLGLSIARAIVDRHGGRIEVASRIGVGTEFTVTLPRAGEEA